MLWGASPKLNTKKKYSFLVTKIRAQGRASKSKKTTGVRKNKTLKGTVQNPNGKFPMAQDSRVSFNRERERERCAWAGLSAESPCSRGTPPTTQRVGKVKSFQKRRGILPRFVEGERKLHDQCINFKTFWMTILETHQLRQHFLLKAVCTEQTVGTRKWGFPFRWASPILLIILESFSQARPPVVTDQRKTRCYCSRRGFFPGPPFFILIIRLPVD